MLIIELLESKEINMARKLIRELSYEARSLLDKWQHYDFRGGNELENAIKENSPVALEIYNTFEPVRRYLKAREGQTIRLHRGLSQKHDSDKERFLQSWTSNPKDANLFAFGRKTLNYKPITDQEIDKAIERFNRTGFTTFRNHKYKLNRNNPKYYDIYDRFGGYVTDGDVAKIRKNFTDEQELIQSYIDRNQGSEVISRDIDIDNIVWIFKLSNEFIVRAS
jgi:hypothetical protein